jgi:hypothetical protein
MSQLHEALETQHANVFREVRMTRPSPHKTQTKPALSRSKTKKSSGLDPFTQKLLMILAVVVPILAYFILKPSPQHQARAVEQVKRFASFIQTQPQLAQNPEPVRLIASAPSNPAPAQSGFEPPITNAEVTPYDPNTALTIEDRIEINNMASQWNQVDFVRDHNWRDQVESMFAIAERTQSPDVYDLIRRQIILGKVDEDAANRIRSETWFERYMKVDTRPVPRKEMEDLFIHSNQ